MNLLRDIDWEAYWELQYWLKSIKETPTQRKQLQKELLAILESPAIKPSSPDILKETLKIFHTRRNILISPLHQQNFSWTPHFSWFWRFLGLFFTSLRNKQGGSALYHQLATKPIIPHKVVLHIDQAAEPMTAVNNQQIPDNLSHDIQQTVTSLHNDLQTLYKKLDTTLDRTAFKELLVQYYNLRTLIHPTDYALLQSKFYNLYPKETALFFHEKNNYAQSLESNPYNIYDLQYLTQYMISHWIINEEMPLQRLYTIEYILFILTEKDPQKITTSLTELIKNPAKLYDTYTECKTNDMELSGELSTEYDGIVKNDYTDSVKKDECVDEVISYRLTHEHNTSQHPIAYYFAHNAVECLIIDNQSIYDSTKKLFETAIHIISNGLLHQPDEKRDLSNKTERLAILEISSLSPLYTRLYENYENMTTHIIQELTQTTPNKAYIKQQLCISDEHAKLNPAEIHWLLSRIKNTCPQHLSYMTTLLSEILTEQASALHTEHAHVQSKLKKSLHFFTSATTSPQKRATTDQTPGLSL